jgi:starch synthase (maltosyl-transferring)
MRPVNNDLWTGSFLVDQLGAWSFTIQGWVDHFDTWAMDLTKRLAAQRTSTETENENSVAGLQAESQDIPLALQSGAILVQEAARRARGGDAKRLTRLANDLAALADEKSSGREYPVPQELRELVSRYPDLTNASRYEPELHIRVDRERARFSTWYELFPRSASSVPGQHGTFSDVERQLPEIAAMGFDVLYLPPIHPIGDSYRKGRNNSTTPQAEDPGSPWAIGNRFHNAGEPDRGGHKSIHPQLGSFEDFDRLVTTAQRHGIEIALDIAFQCSPDHPWIVEHPDWFIHRPDGSIQYAENPPKKYQDIYPLNFESSDWRCLWDELYSVFEFWIQRRVRIFRVDNPHTKALPFWRWCLDTLHENYPDTIYLAEAFTRPHVMYTLAKAGFTQSYTYFTWRTTKSELQSYVEEVTQPPINEFFRPNFWPNTPDILHKSLQVGGKPAFMQRLILAATLTASYGIYGPAYELGENTPAVPPPGKSESEEYLNSEKYEIRHRDRNGPGTLVPLITALNQIRQSNKALQTNTTLQFHTTDNPNLLCYSKSSRVDGVSILVAINIDAVNEQAGWVDIDLQQLGVPEDREFEVEDLLSGTRYTWRGHRNYIALRPDSQPAHIFRVASHPEATTTEQQQQ